MSDIDKLAQATKKSFDKVDGRFDKVEKRLGRVEKRLGKLELTIKDSEKRIIYEFKALAENIHKDVAGANQDKISLIEQKQEVLETRVTQVEQKVGV